MAGDQPLTNFDKTNKSIAYWSVNGLLRVWETESGRLQHEYLPSSHLSTTCTCLRWRPNRKGPMTTKKRKTKQIADRSKLDVNDGHALLAMGMVTGAVQLYNVSTGVIQSQMTENGHTSSVADIFWYPNGERLVSCSTDGFVIEWNLADAHPRKKWASGMSDVSRICLHQNRLILAGRNIVVFDLSQQSQSTGHPIKMQSMTGHSTDVLDLYCMDELDSERVYIISLAYNDRTISVWKTTESNIKVKRTVSTFILNHEPTASSLHIKPETNAFTLSVLTIRGDVEIFTHSLTLTNEASKRPVKPVYTISIQTPRNEPINILSAHLIDQYNVLCMFGTDVVPTFETVNLSMHSDKSIKLTRDEPTTKASVTKVASVGNIMQPRVNINEVTVLAPLVEGGKRLNTSSNKSGKKRSVAPSEMDFSERLAFLQQQSVKDSNIMSIPAESLITQLTQGLQSDDKTMLNKSLQCGDIRVINTTVRRLPPSCVLPLIRYLTKSLQQSGSTCMPGGIIAHTSMIKWVRAILHIHASTLAAFPEIISRLHSLYSLMESRAGQLHTFSKLQGRLELMLSQIARQTSKDEEGSTSAALLTLQDESSDDETLNSDPFADMFPMNSDAEDGYLSGEDEEMKL